MNSLRKVLGFLVAPLMLAAVALSSGAALRSRQAVHAHHVVPDGTVADDGDRLLCEQGQLVVQLAHPQRSRWLHVGRRRPRPLAGTSALAAASSRLSISTFPQGRARTSR